MHALDWPDAQTGLPLCCSHATESGSFTTEAQV